MLAVNMMRTREAAPESLKQEAAADDDYATATASVKVLGLVRASTRAPTQESTPVPVEHDAMAGLTPTELRRKALRMGYAACLLPG